jgi:hypothetical protein
VGQKFRPGLSALPTPTPSPAGQLAFSIQPSATGNTDSYLSTQPVVQVLDLNGNLVASDTSAVTLKAYSDTNCTTEVVGGISAQANPVNAIAGIAIFAQVRVLKTHVIRIGASSGTLTSACSNAVAISAGVPAQLAFSTQPSATGQTDLNLSTQPVVQILDANSNLVTSATNAVTLKGYSDSSCTTEVPGSISAPSNPLAAVSGVASFTFVRVVKTNVIRVGASSGTLTSACSNAVSISPGAAAGLVFSTQPSTTGNADSDLTTQPIVEVVDSQGNRVTSYTGMVTLYANANSASCGTVSDIATGASGNSVSASAGVATFTALRVSKTSAVTLRATGASVSGYSCSNAIAISAGVATQLGFSNQPSATGNADSDLASQPAVQILDANSNVVTTATNAVTLKGYSDANCSAEVVSSLSAQTNPLSAASGVATFAQARVLKTSVIRLGASSGALTAVCSNAISITPGAFDPTASTVVSDQAFITANNSRTATITVTVTDSNGNGISGSSVALSASPGGITITGSPATSNASGIATFTVRSGSTGQQILSATANAVAITDTETVDFVAPSYLSMARTSYVIKEGTSVFTDGANTVTLSRTDDTRAAQVTLQWQTGTETSRFTPGSTTVSFGVGENTKTVPLSNFLITGDSVRNGDLFFTLRLHSPTNGHEFSDDAFAKVWIVDDELPGDFMFDNSLYTVRDNAGSATLRVVRMGDPSGAISVDVTFSSGSAIGGTDFTATPQTVSFGAGEIEKTVMVPVADAASHRSFYAALNYPASAGRLRALSQAKVRILDALEVNNCDPYNTSIGVNNGFGGGAGTVGNPYQICSLGQLGRMKALQVASAGALRTLYFKLMADLDADPTLDSDYTTAGVQAFSEITECPLSFDGNERIVWNFRQTVTGSRHGFFTLGTVNGGGVASIFKNFNLEGAVIIGSSADRIGLLEGESSDTGFGTMPGVRANLYASGRISAPGFGELGGLIGRSYRIATVTHENNFIVSRLIGSSSIGGYVGRNFSGDNQTLPPSAPRTITVIEGTATLGGFIGMSESARLTLTSGQFNSVMLWNASGTAGAWGGIIGSSSTIAQASPGLVLSGVRTETWQYGPAVRYAGGIGFLACSNDGATPCSANLSNLTIHAYLFSDQQTGVQYAGGGVGEFSGDGAVQITNSTFRGSHTGPTSGNSNREAQGGVMGRASMGTGGSLTLTGNLSEMSFSYSRYATQVGGILGYLSINSANGVTAYLDNNQYSGSMNLTGGGEYVGGILGLALSRSSGSASTVRISGQSGNKTFNTGSITVDTSAGDTVRFVGGLIGGYLQRGNGSLQVQNAYNTGPISCDLDYDNTQACGGLIGNVSGYDPGSSTLAISDSFNTGSVSARRDVGGLIGHLSIFSGPTIGAGIERTYSTGAVTLKEDGVGSPIGEAGGLIGIVSVAGSSTLAISKSYSSGSIENLGANANDIAGFIGTVSGNVGVSNCYTTTNILSSEQALTSPGFMNVTGGLPTLSNAHAYQTQLTNGNAQYGLVSGVTPVDSWFYDGSLGTANASNVAQNAAWFTNQTNFTNWDFTNVWELTNGTYPTLRNMPTP